MNFLAHLYLSGDNPLVQVGNFIGDHVKGRNYMRYSPDIQKGILMHRKIDSYTDSHPIVKQSSKRMAERYGRYSGIVIDVMYDHYLGRNWTMYSDMPLSKYVTKVHKNLLSNYFKLPKEVKSFLPFMVKSRRLETYATVEGIHRSLTIMSNYSSLPAESDWAIEQMQRHDADLNAEFIEFFADLKAMVEEELIKVC